MSFFNLFSKSKSSKPSSSTHVENTQSTENPNTNKPVEIKKEESNPVDFFGGMNLNKDKNNTTIQDVSFQGSNNNSVISEKTTKKFDFIKKTNNNPPKEDTRNTFSFINKSPNKPEDNHPIFESNQTPSLELQSDITNFSSTNLFKMNTVNQPLVNEEKTPTNFSFIKKQQNQQVDVVDSKQKKELDTNKIINTIYNTSLNFDKQSVRTIDLQNTKNFEENLMNDLNNSETKSYKSLNPNIQVNNIINNEANTSTVDNNIDNETSNINFQNLVNSDNFGHHTAPSEDTLFKDIQPLPSKFNFVKNRTDSNKEQGKEKLSFLKKKEVDLSSQEPNDSKNNSTNHIPKVVSKAEGEIKENVRRLSEDYKTPESLKNKCKEDLNRSEENLRDLYLKMHKLKKRLLDKENYLVFLNEEIESIQTKENVAIENNDFDEAQRLENLMDNKKDQLKNIKNTIKGDNDEMVKYREQELLLINTKIRNSEEVITNLGKLKNSQNYEYETFQNNEISRHRNDQLKIKKMREKLDIIKVDVENEKNYLKEEEDKVNNAIKSQSSEVFIELDELKINKDKLLEEIEELKRQLQLKYNDLDNLNKNIESKELEIDAIKSNFSHELNKLSKKTNRFNENKKDYEDQENQYEQMCNNYSVADAKIIDKSNIFMKTISDLENDIAEFKQRQIVLNEDLIKKESLLKTENERKSKIYLAQLNIEKIESQKTKNTEEIQSLEINNKRLESDISVIVLKIPRLEEEKQNFVISKNFKEAGRVAGELKAQKEEKDRLSIKTEENKQKISQLKETNLKFDKELEVSIEEKDIEERELNIVRYEYLLTYKIQIEEIIDKLKSKNSNELKTFEEELEIINIEIANLYSLPYLKARFPETNTIHKESELKEEEVVEKVEEAEFKQEATDSLVKEERSNIQDAEEKVEEIDDKSIPENNYTEEELAEMKNDVKNLINSLEQAQKIILESEDYDKADELQKEIDNLQLKLSALDAIVPVTNN